MDKHILVVEDEISLNDALRLKLTHANYKVICVQDGEKGLNSALNSHPDLILLDLMMPRMGGIEMLRRLRLDSWGQTVPVIVLTNVGNVKELESLNTDPNVEMVVKSDISLESLLMKVHSFLERGSSPVVTMTKNS